MEMYELLEAGRKLRNDLVHKMYKSGSLDSIDEKARKSAHYNLYTLISPALSRLVGDEVTPSLQLYANGWNDMRSKIMNDIENRKKSFKTS